MLKRFWTWLTGRREPTAFYPDEEPQTRAERRSELLGEAKAPLDDFPSADYGRQQPFQ